MTGKEAEKILNDIVLDQHYENIEKFDQVLEEQEILQKEKLMLLIKFKKI